jgi:tetratricopeptide (TPR) repeat protein
MLKQNGFRIETNPELPRKFDIVLLDHSRHVFRWIEESKIDSLASKGIPVLCISPPEPARELARALEETSRAVAWLPKPFDLTGLQRTLVKLTEAQFERRQGLIAAGFNDEEVEVLQTFARKEKLKLLTVTDSKTFESVLHYEYSKIRAVLLGGSCSGAFAHGMIPPNRPGSLLRHVPIVLVGLNNTGNLFEKLEASVTAIVSTSPSHGAFSRELAKALRHTRARLCYSMITHRLYQKAMAELRAGNERSGLKLFDQITRLQPNHWDRWQAQAEYFRLKGDLSQAEKALKRALEVNPLSPTIYGRWKAFAKDPSVMKLGSLAFGHHPALETQKRESAP